MSGRTRNNPALSRFELDTDSGIAFANYRRAGNVFTLTHTEVPWALRGRGVGARLVRDVLQMVRQEGGKVVPRCGFVVAFIARNREFADLVQ